MTEQVQLGKTIEKQIETLKDSGPRQASYTAEEYRTRLRKGPKATYPVTVAYTPEEQLEVLIDALEQATVNVIDMEHQLATFMADENQRIARVEFASEDATSSPHILDTVSLEKRVSQSHRLKELLDALRREI